MSQALKLLAQNAPQVFKDIYIRRSSQLRREIELNLNRYEYEKDEEKKLPYMESVIQLREELNELETIAPASVVIRTEGSLATAEKSVNGMGKGAQQIQNPNREASVAT